TNKSSPQPSSSLDSHRADAWPGGREIHDELKERVRCEQWLAARLRLATERLEGAQRERIWAIVKAYDSGLSIRQIASATGRAQAGSTNSSARTRPARSPGGSASSGGEITPTARVRRRPPSRSMPTFRPASRGSWTPSVGAEQRR